MSLSKDFEAFAVDLFSGLGPIRIKRMFGGALAYAGEHGFALLDDDLIYIKIDAENEPAFVAEGCPKAGYPAKDGQVMEMAYRRLPKPPWTIPRPRAAGRARASRRPCARRRRRRR